MNDGTSPGAPTINQEYIFLQTPLYVARLDPSPFTRGTVIITPKRPIPPAKTVLDIPVRDFIDLFLFARRIAQHLTAVLKVERCGMIAAPQGIRLIPMHGLRSGWRPVLSGDAQYHESYPGFITTKNGPRCPDADLAVLQETIRGADGGQPVSNRFYGDQDDQNLFSRLVRGEIPQWRVWEDPAHVAFLTPFPNSPGFTVVVPRHHLSSDIFSLFEKDYVKLLQASHRVAKLLLQGIPGASACAFAFEGLEIDYAHAKLIPIVGDPTAHSRDTDFCEAYEGYISSQDGPLYPLDELVALANMLSLNLS